MTTLIDFKAMKLTFNFTFLVPKNQLQIGHKNNRTNPREEVNEYIATYK